MKATKAPNIDAYIHEFPKETQLLLEQMRAIIHKAAPKAEELISYQMPAFRLADTMLVFFAGYKNHIGFYPSGSGIVEFEEQLSKYKYSKGAIQFPVDQPLPSALITKIVKFRAKQNMQKAKEKAAARKK